MQFVNFSKIMAKNASQAESSFCWLRPYYSLNVECVPIVPSTGDERLSSDCKEPEVETCETLRSAH
ncbi:hypothetical protein KFK09_009250 [Dendrobium nobile]|uniref:Uncharacterized protein n=1 Tax=Dendrobium nobile TaxID=94219 RepID=A0A8T3BT08_DENNO|nr:hypothetical protein KFK09_009250 [Dendrobium nobile]